VVVLLVLWQQNEKRPLVYLNLSKVRETADGWVGVPPTAMPRYATQPASYFRVTSEKTCGAPITNSPWALERCSKPPWALERCSKPPWALERCSKPPWALERCSKPPCSESACEARLAGCNRESELLARACADDFGKYRDTRERCTLERGDSHDHGGMGSKRLVYGNASFQEVVAPLDVIFAPENAPDGMATTSAPLAPMNPNIMPFGWNFGGRDEGRDESCQIRSTWEPDHEPGIGGLA
jgi:hypothetical protein